MITIAFMNAIMTTVMIVTRMPFLIIASRKFHASTFQSVGHCFMHINLRPFSGRVINAQCTLPQSSTSFTATIHVADDYSLPEAMASLQTRTICDPLAHHNYKLRTWPMMTTVLLLTLRTFSTGNCWLTAPTILVKLLGCHGSLMFASGPCSWLTSFLRRCSKARPRSICSHLTQQISKQ